MRHVIPWQALPHLESSRRLLRSELRAIVRSARVVAGEINSQVRWSSLVLAAVALVLGLVFAAQLQSTPGKAAVTPESRREQAAQTIARLEQEQAELKKAIADLRARVAAEQQMAANAKSTLAEISEELDRQKMLAGMVPLRGRGVKVVLDDSSATKIPPGDDASLYIVHEYQLRDVLNLLWLYGAEAVSLNGERIVATTSIYCVGSTILVNDTRLSPPYEFLAIGDPAVLESALNDPANLQALKTRVKSYGVQFAVEKSSQLLVPAYSGSLEVKYTTPASVESSSEPLRQQGSRTGEK